MMEELNVIAKGYGWSIHRTADGNLHLTVDKPARWLANERQVSVQLPSGFVAELLRQKQALRLGADESEWAASRAVIGQPPEKPSDRAKLQAELDELNRKIEEYAGGDRLPSPPAWMLGRRIRLERQLEGLPVAEGGSKP